MYKRKEYEGWSNERMDKLIADKPFERISDVDRWNDKVTFKCNVCGNEFKTTPNTISQGSGCPICRRNNQKGSRRKAKYTYDEVVQFCKEAGFELLEDTYKNSSTPMHMKCVHCGNITKKQLRVLKQGYTKCTNCGK